MTAFYLFNLTMLLLGGAVLGGLIPQRLLGLLRGLHNTIGISTPTDRQLRWVLVVWLLCTAAIVDGLALLLYLLPGTNSPNG